MRLVDYQIVREIHYRLSRGDRPVDVARDCRVSQRTVGRIRSGEIPPELRRAQHRCRGCGGALVKPGCRRCKVAAIGRRKPARVSFSERAHGWWWQRTQIAWGI